MADRVNRSFLVHVPDQRRPFVDEQKWCLTWLMTVLVSLLIKNFSVKHCMVIFMPCVCSNQNIAVYSGERSVVRLTYNEALFWIVKVDKAEGVRRSPSSH